MAQVIKKLRRATLSLPAKEGMVVDSVAPVFWRGILLNDLALALSQRHHIQYIWRQLALSISMALGDHAVALAEMNRHQGAPKILADDGLHDELRQAILKDDARCPFLKSPEIHINNIQTALIDNEEGRLLYELIEHYWGWRLTSRSASSDGADSCVYLMLFGADAQEPHDLAQNLFLLSSYIVSHARTEKMRSQLTAELSAETQCRRIHPATALKVKLDQWVALNDDRQ